MRYRRSLLSPSTALIASALITTALIAASCSTATTADTASTTTAIDEPTSAAPTTTTPVPDLSPFADELTTAVRSDLSADPQLIGQIAMISAGGRSINAAAGLADPTTGVAIEPTMSFRIASVTKTFVAAATLRLVESGEFTAETPIASLLPAALVTALVEGGYQPERITVRQLLTHTSGVLDFTFAPGLDYVGQVIADPQREWTRQDQVELAMLGAPVGGPGETYHYSDTGYALLGAIIEQATGDNLGASLRSLLDYDRLGLDHTYLELIEPTPAEQPPRVHQFFGDLDTFAWSPTIDLYGGGGLVSTLPDLSMFFRSLLSGEVFDDPATLLLMLDVPDTNTDVRVPGDPRPYAAAAGLFRGASGGQECWGHEGFWGVSVTYCPELDAGYAVSVSQATRSPAYDPSVVAAVAAEVFASLPLR